MKDALRPDRYPGRRDALEVPARYEVAGDVDPARTLDRGGRVSLSHLVWSDPAVAN